MNRKPLKIQKKYGILAGIKKPAVSWPIGRASKWFNRACGGFRYLQDSISQKRGQLDI